MSSVPPPADEIRFLEGLFDRTHDAVFIIGLDMHYITVNQAAAEMLGYTREELIGMTPGDVTPPEFMGSASENIRRLLNGERLDPFERVLMRKDGSRITTEVSTQLVYSEQGVPSYFQSIVRDITTRKAAEHQTLELALEMERSRILTEFIMAASHEFRTPLSQINTSLHIMKRLNSDPALLRRVAQIQQSVDRISDLVSRMLLLVQLESGISREIVPLDVPEMLYDVEVSYTLKLSSHQVQIARHIDPDLPRIAGDARGLHIALRELLDNAIKASSPGGLIGIGARPQGEYVVITIQDHGEGIAPDDLLHIFERFYRADKSRNRPGFGLGLSIAKLVVDQHNGMIDVQSTPGAGTTFRVLLPRLHE